MRPVSIPGRTTAAHEAKCGGGPARHREKPIWYAPAAITVDTLGVLVPVLIVFFLAGQSRAMLAAVVAATAWVSIRAAHGRYGWRSLGESRGLLTTSHDWLLLIGLLAILRVATGESSAVVSALAALSPSLAVTGAAGALTHRHLTSQRRQAQAVRRVLLVGEATLVDSVTGQLAARTDHAYVVIGAVPAGTDRLASGVPELGRLPAACPARDLPVSNSAGPRQDGSEDGAAVLAAARRHGADLVLLTPGHALAGERLRRLIWAIQDHGLSLTVASGLTEVARRRIRVSTAAGLNLLHLTPPVRHGPQWVTKAVLDRAGAALGLLLLFPLLLAIALTVRLDSAGPALFRQTRIGHLGVPFTLWKFRTMNPQAELRRPELAGANEQSGPLFKIRADPRITRVGRFLRRSSLDELPQLFNVLRGQMSLVGPRPPLPEEVASYGPIALRRLSVKPGVTGPWQVSGRSELSWDEGLALDLSYADNWSMTGDLDVLARTARAVVNGHGAY